MLPFARAAESVGAVVGTGVGRGAGVVVGTGIGRGVCVVVGPGVGTGSSARSVRASNLAFGAIVVRASGGASVWSSA